jgi:hypothetical protein
VQTLLDRSALEVVRSCSGFMVGRSKNDRLSLLIQEEGHSMAADPSTDFQIGDRVRYVEGIRSSGLRRGQVGTIIRIFTDGTSGPLRADVKFDDEVEAGVSIALLDLA